MLVIDHIVPVNAGGTNDIENLATSCEECNQGKSDRPILGPHPTQSQLAEIQGIREERFDLAGHLAMVSALIEERAELRDLVAVLYENETGLRIAKTSSMSLLMGLYEEFGDDLATMLAIVSSKELRGEGHRMRYLCGIARNMREAQRC